MRARALATALAGPFLIVAGVLVALHDVAFLGRVSNQHVDLLLQWMPNFCFLGDSLASGHIPVWNPHVMTGLPFAADPQSGWMHAPAMLLHTALPCGTAIRWLLVLQPALAGLGAYWFLRAEDASRPAATLAGGSLAMAMAASRIVLTVPFAGTLAWTMLMLACAARWVRAGSWPGRLGWTVAVAACWGQVAVAHLSHGLAIATLALAVYLVARAPLLGARKRALPAIGVLVAALPLVNLAALLPRFAYLPRTTLWLGYRELERIASTISGGAPSPEIGAAAGAGWPGVLGASPGAALGLLPLALTFLAWRSRPHRRLVIAFAVLAVGSYLLSLRSVAGVLRHLPFTDFYVHEPGRMRYGVLLALPVLAGLGFDAWRARRGTKLLAAGAGAWVVFALASGASPARLALPLLGAAAAAGALVLVWKRPALVGVVPVVLVAELTVGALLGQRFRSEEVPGMPSAADRGPLTQLLEPDIDPRAYLRPTALEEQLRGQGRFLSLDPSRLEFRGYIEHQEPGDWGLLANQRAVLLGLEDAQGYNPAQPVSWWRFVREDNRSFSVKYNEAVFAHPSAFALDRLNVTTIVGPAGPPPLPGLRPGASDGRWQLFAVPNPAPRVTVHTRSEDGRIPATRLEGASARFRSLGPSAAQVVVDTPTRGVVLIRVQHDPNWAATVDGRPAEVLRADGFLQAVAVPAGHHVIELGYDDPWVGRGMAGSAVTLIALAMAALVLRRREQR